MAVNNQQTPREDPVKDDTDPQQNRPDSGFQLLDQEPKKLHAECTRLTNEINSLSGANFNVHLQNFENLRSIREACGVMAKEVEVVESQLPPLAETCGKFCAIGTRIVDKFRRNRQAHRRHNQLYELLELPQVMNMCVRQKLFPEALNLCNFSDNLLKRHTAIHVGIKTWSSTQQKSTTPEKEHTEDGKGLQVITAIAQEVDRGVELLREQLLLLLKQPISIPTCIAYVGYLRQIDARAAKRSSLAHQVTNNGTTQGESNNNSSSSLPPDHQLRREFLDCRDAFGASESNMRDKAVNSTSKVERDAYRTLIETIERNRRSWLDLINLYTVVFGQSVNGGDALQQDGGILACWISSRIAKFLGLLQTQLDQIHECGSIARVMDQCMFFGTSLAKVKADFRPNMQLVFHQRIHSLMLEYWEPITLQTSEEIRAGNWGSPLPTPQEFGANNVNHGELLNPPLNALSFPIIAEWVNVMIISFNELKQCAPLPLVQVVAKDYSKCIDSISESLIQFERDNTDALKADDKSRRRFGELIHLWTRQVVPFVDKCICTVFHLNATEHSNAVGSVTGLDHSEGLKQCFANLSQEYPSAFTTLFQGKPDATDVQEQLSQVDTNEQQPEVTNDTAGGIQVSGPESSENGVVDDVATSLNGNDSNTALNQSDHHAGSVDRVASMHARIDSSKDD